jgi:hypothetical protein
MGGDSQSSKPILSTVGLRERRSHAKAVLVHQGDERSAYRWSPGLIGHDLSPDRLGGKIPDSGEQSADRQ